MLFSNIEIILQFDPVVKHTAVHNFLDMIHKRTFKMPETGKEKLRRKMMNRKVTWSDKISVSLSEYLKLNPRLGKKNPFFGRRHSIESKKKMSIAHQSRPR